LIDCYILRINVAMDILHAMTVFVAVVDHNSLIRAADALGTSGAAVSRQIAALEDHVGARLLHRTTRRMSLTDAGQDYFNRAKQILSDVAEAGAAAGESAVQPTGLLRISAPLSFAVNRLSRWLPDFMATYPRLRLDLDLTDRQVDLATDGIDVAVRIARQPATTNVIARRITTVRSVVCASPAYIARRGAPQVPADLIHHDTLSYSYLSTGDHWRFRNADGAETDIRLRPILHASNGDMLCELAARGAGIIMEPDFMVARHMQSGHLTPILTDWASGGLNVYALYLSRKFLSAKVRVFIDELQRMEGA
jgi:DNA-binding transcriptional LysR family regulator